MKTSTPLAPVLAMTVAAAMTVVAPPAAEQTPTAPRRFVIDSHQHYRDDPQYIDTLVKVYRPRRTQLAGCHVCLREDRVRNR